MQSVNSRISYNKDYYVEISTESHHSTLKKMQDKERNDFNSLSQEEKVKHIRFQIENALEYEDLLEEYSEEETDELATKIANGSTDYTNEEKDLMNVFESCHEHGINDANYEVQYIYDTWMKIQRDNETQSLE